MVCSFACLFVSYIIVLFCHSVVCVWLLDLHVFGFLGLRVVGFSLNSFSLGSYIILLRLVSAASSPNLVGREL